MSAEKKTTELKDEQLEEVSGGKISSPVMAATLAASIIGIVAPIMGVDNKKIATPGANAQDDTE